MLLAISLAFAAVVMTVNVIDVADTVRCEEARTADECYDGGSAQKTATVVAGIASALLGLIGSVLAFWGAVQSRIGPAVLPLTFATLALGLVTILLNA